jgi:polyisoprenoid-binding protein YceI
MAKVPALIFLSEAGKSASTSSFQPDSELFRRFSGLRRPKSAKFAHRPIHCVCCMSAKSAASAHTRRATILTFSGVAMFPVRSISLLAAAFLVCNIAHATPVTYTIGSKLSRVSFNLEHQGFIQSFGTLKIVPGSFVFDSDDWSKSSVAVTMPVKSLDMGDALWNEEIRGDDAWDKLFKTKTISFHSKQLQRIDAMHGTLTGDLTLAGVTKPVTLQLKLNKLGANAISKIPAVGFTATGTIKRSQFGLDAYADLIGDDMSVQIQLEAFVGDDPDAEIEKQMGS